MEVHRKNAAHPFPDPQFVWKFTGKNARGHCTRAILCPRTCPPRSNTGPFAVTVRTPSVWPHCLGKNLAQCKYPLALLSMLDGPNEAQLNKSICRKGTDVQSGSVSNRTFLERNAFREHGFSFQMNFCRSLSLVLAAIASKHRFRQAP